MLTETRLGVSHPATTRDPKSCHLLRLLPRMKSDFCGSDYLFVARVLSLAEYLVETHLLRNHGHAMALLCEA